jgi:hypothetical protein
MKYHKIVAELLTHCDSTTQGSDSWDIETNGELRLAWTEEYVVQNATQIYKDLLNMETAVNTAIQQFRGLECAAEAHAERLRQALQ